MKSLIIRIIHQMLNDKRTLALILIAPMLILTLLFLLLGDSSYKPTLAIEDTFPKTIVTALEKQDVDIITMEKDTDIDQYLKDKNADAVITMDSKGMHIKMLETDSVKSSEVSSALKSALAEVNPSASMEMTFVYGNADASIFDNLGYMLIGVLSFFFVFLIAGIAFVRERTTGTLERLMLTPIKRTSVIMGYTLGFGLFAALQSIIIILFTKYVLNMPFEGSVFLAMLIMILLAITAISLGTLVSIFANNEFQMMQFIPIIIIPQIFFSGLISIDTLPYGLNYLAYIMPVYYGCMGLNNVLIKGFGIESVAFDISILALMIIVLFILNTLALKRYRRL